jgi:hypothetical protein
MPSDNKSLDEQLSAYLDGELDLQQKQAIEQLIADDPVIAQQYKNLHRLSQALQTSANEINQNPLPKGVQQMLADNLKRKPSLLSRLKAFFSNIEWTSPSVYALASALLMAVIVPVAFHQIEQNQSSELSNEFLITGSPLKAVLDFTPSGQTTFLADAQITPVYSFKTHDNHFCREITRKASDVNQRGIACNTQGSWKIVVATSAVVLPDKDTYITASASDSDLINRFVDDNIAGDVLSLDDEYKAMQTYSQDLDK